MIILETTDLSSASLRTIAERIRRRQGYGGQVAHSVKDKGYPQRVGRLLLNGKLGVVKDVYGRVSGRSEARSQNPE